MSALNVESADLAMRALGDVAEVRLGKTPRKAAYRSDGEFKIIKFRDILESGEIDWDNGDMGFVSDTPEALAGLRELQVGDVLVTASAHMSEHIGKKAALVKSIPSCFKEVFVVGEILQIRAKPGIDPRWVLNYVRSHYGYKAIQKKVHGVHLLASRAREIELPVVEFGVQQCLLAEIEKQFSRLDEAVANLKRVKAHLKRYTVAVLQAATRGDFTSESASGSDGGLPPQWRWFTVQQLASPEPRSIQSGPFGSNLKHSEFQDTGRLVIGIDNVQDGEFSKGADHRISEAKFEELSKYAARPRDVLITVMATIGRVCVVPDQIEPSIITKHVYRITVNRELAAPEYLAIALRGASQVRAQLLGSVQGQTRPGLNGTLIKQIRIPTPPVEEQHRIVAEVDRRLSHVREVVAEVDVNWARAQALRRSLLAQSVSTFGLPEHT